MREQLSALSKQVEPVRDATQTLADRSAVLRVRLLQFSFCSPSAHLPLTFCSGGGEGGEHQAEHGAGRERRKTLRVARASGVADWGRRDDEQVPTRRGWN